MVIRVLVATATTVLVIRVETATPRPGLHVSVETVPIRLAPPATEIHGRHAQAVVTAPTRLALPATGIRVHAARATIALVFPAVTAIPVRPEPVVVTVPIIPVPRAMAIPRVGLRVRGETAPIRRAPRATARVRTDLEAIAQIVHAPIAHMVISRAVSGNPMGESVVRSARR
jgi:hypothetical protein